MDIEEMAKMVGLFKMISEQSAKTSSPGKEMTLEKFASTYYGINERFKVGDKVEFKKGLRDVKWPAEGQYGIIVEIIDPPMRDMSEGMNGSPYYGRPMDMRVALKNDAGEIHIYPFDSRRLKSYSPDKKKA